MLTTTIERPREGTISVAPVPKMPANPIVVQADPMDRSLLKGLHRWESEGGAVWGD